MQLVYWTNGFKGEGIRRVRQAKSKFSRRAMLPVLGFPGLFGSVPSVCKEIRSGPGRWTVWPQKCLLFIPIPTNQYICH